VTGLGLTRVPRSQRRFDAGVSHRWGKCLADLMVTDPGHAPRLVIRDRPPRT
jgi:hypothetical protein